MTNPKGKIAKTALPLPPVCLQAAKVKLRIAQGKTNLPGALLLCVLLMTASHRSSGQLGTWNIVNLKSKINDKWSYFIEAQMRSLSFYSDMNYYEVKGLAAYSVNPNFQVGAGMGSYNTFQNEGNFTKPLINREFRTWQQAVLRQNAGRLKMEHRYRAEQRFTSNGYRNRFRYRFNLALPLNHREVVPGTFYLMVWDEIFLNNRAPVFERNRFFAGCGYELSATTAIQSGFLSQYDYTPASAMVRKYLQISLLLTLHAEKEKTWFRQGVPD